MVLETIFIGVLDGAVPKKGVSTDAFCRGILVMSVDTLVHVPGPTIVFFGPSVPKRVSVFTFRYFV